MPLCLFNWMSSQWNCLIKLSINTQRAAVTFVAPSARSYLFHFILSTNKSKTSATKRWDFTFWTCLSNRLPSDFVLPKGYNESMLNSDSQFLSVICVMLESKTEGEKKVRNGLLLSDLQPWGHQWKWSWSRVVQSSPPPPPPPSRPPSPPLLPPIFFFFFLLSVTVYGSYCNCVYRLVNMFSFPVSIWKEVLKPLPFSTSGHTVEQCCI